MAGFHLRATPDKSSEPTMVTHIGPRNIPLWHARRRLGQTVRPIDFSGTRAIAPDDQTCTEVDPRSTARTKVTAIRPPKQMSTSLPRRRARAW
jgi:hypothetical protein